MLSKSYDYDVEVKQTAAKDSSITFDSIYVIIKQKGSDNINDIIACGLEGGILSFSNPCYARSFVTGYCQNDTIVDGRTGDLVIADLNFDGREDIAIIKGQGYADFYNFYIQDKNGKFHRSKFLSEKMGLWPDDIKQSDSTLVTSRIVGYNHIETTKYKYVIGEKMPWKEIADTLEELQ